MESFWNGFEKRAGIADVAKAGLGWAKNLAGRAATATGSGLNRAGGFISNTAGAASKRLPKGAQNFGNAAVGAIKANPVKSALGATAAAGVLGRASAPSQPRAPQY